MCLVGFTELEEMVLFLLQGWAKQTRTDNLRHGSSAVGPGRGHEAAWGWGQSKPDHESSRR